MIIIYHNIIWSLLLKIIQKIQAIINCLIIKINFNRKQGLSHTKIFFISD